MYNVTDKMNSNYLLFFSGLLKVNTFVLLYLNTVGSLLLSLSLKWQLHSLSSRFALLSCLLPT